MNDFKSKLPDLQELSTIAQKLFKDVKNSVGEIVTNYKAKREQQSYAEPSQKDVTASVNPTAKPSVSANQAQNKVDNEGTSPLTAPLEKKDIETDKLRDKQ